MNNGSAFGRSRTRNERGKKEVAHSFSLKKKFSYGLFNGHSWLAMMDSNPRYLETIKSGMIIFQTPLDFLACWMVRLSDQVKMGA